MTHDASLLLLPGFVVPAVITADDKSCEEIIENLAEKLGRRMFVYPNHTEEQTWLHKTAAALLERTKKAGEAILEARNEANEANDEDDHEDAERDLARDYFRVRDRGKFPSSPRSS